MNNKLLFKKIISSVLSVLIVFSCSSVVIAKTLEQQIKLSLAPIYSENFDTKLSGSLTPSQEELAESINAQLKAFKTEVDISNFYLRNNEINKQLIVNILSGELPECFHISTSFSIRYTSTYITKIIPKYEYTLSRYNQMLSECEDKADALLNGIEGNPSLTDEEKLLLLHDRIALNCEYDSGPVSSIPRISHTMYGVLAKGVAVCQGYAIAYGYLLDKIGIKNSYCSSSALCHAWNIVYINGTPYHVDITWDDPKFDVTGRVNHNNFLLSSDALWETGHKAYDYDTSPMSNKYDNYFWQNSSTAFVLVDNEIYYVDNLNDCIKRKSDREVICSVECIWKSGIFQVYNDNYTKLDTDGTDLLYSLNDGIYRYDLSTGETTKIYSPILPKYHNVFGFTLDGGEMVVETYDSPNYDATTKENYTERVIYFPANTTDTDYIPGDIDKDSVVSLLDVVTLSQYLAGWNVYCNLAALDVNRDKEVNLKDILHLAKFVSKWEGIVAY